MTRVATRVAFASVTALTLGIAGCFSTDICEYARCTGAGGSSGTETSGTQTGGMTSSTGLPAACDPSQLPVGMSIDSMCGVFVEPGATGGDGTQSTPYGTLAAALADDPLALPIYVCSTGAPLKESAELVAAEHLIGGVTCGDWQASATKTPWNADANVIPLRLTQTSGAIVERFAIAAAPAMGFDPSTLEGRSSIGVIADNATATFADVDIFAGAGATGGNGESQSGQAPGHDDSPALFDGNAGSGCNIVPGSGVAKEFHSCPAQMGTSTQGGAGGTGGSGSGMSGDVGLPNFATMPPQGKGGTGDDASMAWSCATVGKGDFGHDGPNGNPGIGGSGDGAVDSTGYHGPSGKPGEVGHIGQGGGGGGGRQKLGCSSTGTSGGGGGAGGCGGLAGGGGGAGGASIALVSLESTLTFTNVTLTAAAGGDGGNGGDGQAGGAGGAGAFGGSQACKGGDGGKGGDGSGGGGGSGGPSIGLAFTGANAPMISDSAITTSMANSNAGLAGGGNVPGTGGTVGYFATTKAF